MNKQTVYYAVVCDVTTLESEEPEYAILKGNDGCLIFKTRSEAFEVANKKALELGNYKATAWRDEREVTEELYQISLDYVALHSPKLTYC